MELYDATQMPLSKDENIRNIQIKKLNGKELTISEKFTIAGRDETIRKIGNYECKKDHCYRAITEEVLEIYKKSGFIKDERRVDYIDGENNQGIDWYLGGAMPRNRYGFIIIECPADKQYFVPSFDNGLGMSDEINVRHMKSSPQRNPIPVSMITNVFDYRMILQEQEAIFDEIRNQEMMRMSKLRVQQFNDSSLLREETSNEQGGINL